MSRPEARQFGPTGIPVSVIGQGTWEVERNDRAIEHAVIPVCRQHGVAVVAYSPFGSGSFPAPDSTGAACSADIAATHEATPHAIVLSFLRRDEAVFAIPKSSRIGHVEANALAGSITLDDDEIARIDEVFPRGRGRRLPMI